LAGTAAQADARAAAFEAAVAALHQRYAGLPPLRVFFQIWPRPLMTVNGHHLISRALALCGAQNVFADLAPLVPTVSEEAVVAADPDAILAGSAQGLAAWQGLHWLRATRQGHLLVVDAQTLGRGSDRMVPATAALCAQLDAVRAAPPR
ncbi:MAG: cobalamin-binding protein, partial [Burkholderiales bacterium]|nr:cobalamin-binding protein [Burkholderiales bacterium]